MMGGVSGDDHDCLAHHATNDVIYPQTVVVKRKLLLFLLENPSCLGPISSLDKSYWYNNDCLAHRASPLSERRAM